MSSSSVSSLVRGADIIDLDRYMRCNVRPSNPRHTRDRLVVDAGGVGVVGTVGVGAVGVSASSGSDSARTARRDKRYWHDSGLSDGSCAKPRRKSQRQAVESGSVHEFRAACERALRDQQQQLARVTQLCELLLQAPGGEVLDHSAQVSKRNFGQNVSPCSVPRRRRASSRSSSSSSSRRAHRSESCRTYDIIVSKLDELSRLFAARRVAAPAAAPVTASGAAPATAPAAAPAAVPVTASGAAPAACPAEVSAAATHLATPHVTLQTTEEPVLQAAHVRRAQGDRCVVARVHELDIAPCSAGSCGDECSVRRESGLRVARCELDDRVRLHARASTQRAGEQRGGSLCALCRCSWRRLTRRLFGACS